MANVVRGAVPMPGGSGGDHPLRGHYQVPMSPPRGLPAHSQHDLCRNRRSERQCIPMRWEGLRHLPCPSRRIRRLPEFHCRLAWILGQDLERWSIFLGSGDACQQRFALLRRMLQPLISVVAAQGTKSLIFPGRCWAGAASVGNNPLWTIEGALGCRPVVVRRGRGVRHVITFRRVD